MKTERELFEDVFVKPLHVTWNEKKGKYVTEYGNAEIVCAIYNNMWQAWQASASREGYKLVPVEPTTDMIKAYYSTPKPTAERCYKSMIAAVGH